MLFKSSFQMESKPLIVNQNLSLENLSDEIYPLIKSIRPDWNSSNTRLVKFTEGITNTILGLFSTTKENDVNEDNALVIKLFGNHTELFIDRQSEFESMIKLSSNGVLSQKILIEFSNGVIYEYASGRACSRDDVRQEHIAQLIAMKLAEFHSVPVIKQDDEPLFLILSKKFLHLLNDYQEEKENIRIYLSDLNRIEKEILPQIKLNDQLGSDLVLCHNDLLVKNILYDEKKDQISIIDFEYTKLNYSLFDIANHFVEYAGVDDADFTIYPTRDEQKRWLKIYFSKRQINEDIVNDELCQLIDRFSALAHLMWGLWALVQSHLSELDFDYVHYAHLRLSSYQRLKSILFKPF